MKAVLAPSEELLLEQLVAAPGEPALLLGAGSGGAAPAMATACLPGELLVLDSDLPALRRAEEALASARCANARLASEVDLPEALSGRVAHAALLAPPNRDLGRRRLYQAYLALRPGGRLLLAGAKAEGIEPLAAAAATLFAGLYTADYRKGCRVVCATRPPDGPLPAWVTAPGIAPGSWQSFTADLPGGPQEFVTLPGVFAAERLDAGTALLLEHMALQPAERVLDLGCGCGIIGIAAALAGAAAVELCDINLLAVAAAQQNAERLVPGRCRVVAAAGFEAARGLYDLIVSNPPFHSGKVIDYAAAHAFIGGARAYLTRGGRLLLVANRFLAYERLMADYYAYVALIADNGRYRVWMGRV